jgi:hypothetical protein
MISAERWLGHKPCWSINYHHQSLIQQFISSQRHRARETVLLTPSITKSPDHSHYPHLPRKGERSWVTDHKPTLHKITRSPDHQITRIPDHRGAWLTQIIRFTIIYQYNLTE